MFISYAHDCDAHRELSATWIFFARTGVDARIEHRAAEEQPQDWPPWIDEQVAHADRILIVSTAAYRGRRT